MNPLYKLLLAAAVALVVLVAALPGPLAPGPTDAARELTLYAAAALRAPIEAAAADYRAQHGVKIKVHYGGSSTLLSQIEVTGHGDLFAAADATYLHRAKEKQLARSAVLLAKMRAVVVVPAGNPRGVESLADLMPLRLSLANPDQAAIGAATRDALRASSTWQTLEQQVRSRGVFKPTVGEVLNDVKLGAVDAGIVWDAVAAPHDDLQSIELPELATATGDVGVCVLTASRRKELAEPFVRYLATAGRQHFVANGFCFNNSGPAASED